MGIVIKIKIIIIVDGLNISLDARDVTQMNNTSIPPKKIKNKIYENQNDTLIRPVEQQIKIVCNNKLRPIAKGCEI